MALAESLALKYRPKKFSQVIGQPIVVRAFTNAFKSNNLHHAYILGGNWGTGKTTMARIVAATENCKKGGKDPCGTCSNCKDIFSGKSSEVIEIDAGSSGKIDEIRNLQKTLVYSPVECRTKYVIIDEAHDMTKDAAEASLKMIEEPPPHVRFILCTTEPQSFKPTIHSRCIMWSFNKVSWHEMYDHLKMIVEKEQLKYEDDALKIAARYAKGSVRNSIQNLQTIMNFVGEESLTTEAARQALGVINESLYFYLIEAISKKDFKKCFEIINLLFQDGKEVKFIMDGLYEHLNNLLVVRTCKDELENLEFSQEEIKRYKHQNLMISGNSILKMMNFLSQLAFGIEYGLNPAQLFNKFCVESVFAVKSSKSNK